MQHQARQLAQFAEDEALLDRSLLMTQDPQDLFRQALGNPEAHFESPQSLAASPILSHGQKVELLRRWYFDACKLQAAEGEGMVGGERAIVGETVRALHSLGATADPPK